MRAVPGGWGLYRTTLKPVEPGEHELRPIVSTYGDQPLESCLFDETNYRNPDPWAEKVGRTILNLNDAVVIMPRHPLAADATYTVQVTANGEIHTWQFDTIKRPN